MRFARPTLLRPITIDVVVAGALGAAALVGALVEDLHPSGGVARRLDTLGGLLIVGMTLPLMLRRLFPRAVAIVTVSCAVAAIVLGYPGAIGLLGTLFALGSLAYTTTRHGTLLVGIPAGVALVAGFAAAPGSGSVTNVVANLLVIASTLLIGDLLRTRRDQSRLLAERNRELEPLRGEVNADDPLSTLQPAPGDRAKTDHAGANDDD